jgi:uncharacterized protein YaiI (UPF0178 family)
MPAFVIDENLPVSFVDMASEHGWPSVWVRNVMPGAADQKILQRLRSTGEILVTRDVRFANIVLRLMVLETSLAGAVLIREERLRHMQAAWRWYLEHSPILEDALIVADRYQLRVRRQV